MSSKEDIIEQRETAADGRSVCALPPTRGMDRRAGWRQFGLLLAIVLFIGLPIRLIVVNRSAMVSRDTVTFIWYAQAIADDPLAAMREHDQHPLYPAAVLAANRAIQAAAFVPASVRSDPVRSWTAAAVSVSLLGGLALIVAVYLLTSSLFDPQTGLAAAVLAAAAAELCQLSADGLTDMPHLAVYLAAVWAGLRGFQTLRNRWFLLAGVLSGLNYLIRPEGAEPAVVIAAMLIVPYICSMAWRRRLAAVCCVVVGSALVASPYMVATGKLVQKKSIWRFLQQDAATAEMPGPQFCGEGMGGWGVRVSREGIPAEEGCEKGFSHQQTLRGGVSMLGVAGDVPRAMGSIVENWARSLRGTFLLPFLAWVVWQKRYPADRMGTRIVQGAVGLHLAILVALIVQFDYWDLFSLRHVMVLTGLTLPFAAAGLAAIIESLPERRQGWAAVLLGFGLVAPTLPWIFEVRHREDAHLRSAAAWMRENTPERPRVLTERFRMAFYAGGDYIPGPLTADVPEYLARARQSGPHWMAFDERRMLKESPTFFADLDGSLVSGEVLELSRVEMNKLPQGTRRVLVYHYKPPT